MCKWQSKISGYKCDRTPLEDNGYCLFHKPNKNEFEAHLFWKIINFNIYSQRYIDLKNKLYRDGRHNEKVALQIEEELKRNYEQNFTIEEKQREDYEYYRDEIVKLYYSSKIMGKENLPVPPDFNGFVFPKADFEEYVFRYKINPFHNRLLKFSEVTFEGYMVFAGYKFIGETIFEHCSFKHGTTFKNAIFHEDCSFIDSDLETTFNILGSGIFQNTQFLGNIVLFDNVRGLIRFDSVFSPKTELKLVNMHYPEDYSRASFGEEAYRMAKNRAFALGKYNDASKYFYKERIYLRKQMFPGFSWCFYDKNLKGLKKIRFFNSLKENMLTAWEYRNMMLPHFFDYLMDFFTGYGEKPNRIILASLAVISLFAFCNMIIESISLVDSFFYSFITFTTLGAKIPNPDNLSFYMKFALSIESFLGGIFMALFVLTLSKKYGK